MDTGKGTASAVPPEAPREEQAFLELAERFRAAADPEEVKQLGDEMGRAIFGE